MHRYYVSYNIDFFKTRAVNADNAEEAIKKAMDLETSNQKTMSRLGYVIGEMDVIDSSRDGEVTGTDARKKNKSPVMIPNTYSGLRERERNYCVGDD
jgi:hypothetical protein